MKQEDQDLVALFRGLDTAAVIDRVLEVDLATFDAGFEAFLLDRFSGWTYRAPSTREQLRARLTLARERRSDGSAASRAALACIDHRKWADADIWSSRALAADPENGDARLVMALLALMGAGAALLERHFRLALFGAVAGILSWGFLLGSLLSLAALLLLLGDRELFET